MSSIDDLSEAAKSLLKALRNKDREVSVPTARAVLNAAKEQVKALLTAAAAGGGEGFVSAAREDLAQLLACDDEEPAVEWVGSGDDFVVFSLARHFALRFPKTPDAATWLQREEQLFPVIAPLLFTAASTSVPIHLVLIPSSLSCNASSSSSSSTPVDTPSLCYPFPWVLYKLIHGRQGYRTLHPEEVEGLAETMGQLLGALHSVAAERVAAIADPSRGHDSWDPSAYRRTVVEDLLEEGCESDPPLTGTPLEVLLGMGLAPDLARLAADLLDPAATEAPPALADRGWERLVHGDLDPEHVLLGASGGVEGIIDWSDARVGDPVRDLAAMFSWGGISFLERLLLHYPVHLLDPGAPLRLPFLARLCSLDGWFSTRGGPTHDSAHALLRNAFGYCPSDTSSPSLLHQLPLRLSAAFDLASSQR